MIKYIELTAPDASAFRQAKILSIECQEGEQIKEGDTLFRVQSGAHEINLPATRTGRIVELIVELQENITLSTALLLLETEVNGSTASTPIASYDDGAISDTGSNAGSPNEPGGDEQSASVSPGNIEQSKTKTNAIRKTKTKAPSSENVTRKKHQQQSLDLVRSDLFDSDETSERQDTDNNEVVLTQKATLMPAEPNHHTDASPSMTSNSIIAVTVPDIGTDSAKVIEILVNVGDSVATEDPLVTLESDKASMDVPSTNDGVVKTISVEIDQDVSEGTLILELESQTSSQDKVETSKSVSSPATDTIQQPHEEQLSSEQSPPDQTTEVRIPDIGGDSAKVIEILINIGDQVDIEDPLLTLESDKASMDVPSSTAGIIQSIEVELDQDVSEGTLVVTVLTDASNQAPATKPEKIDASDKGAAVKQSPATSAKPPSSSSESASVSTVITNTTTSKSHASPSIRRFARELGVDLGQVSGSGRKGRVTHDDVKGFVKGIISSPPKVVEAKSSGSGIPQVPAQDFSKFGEIDVQPLNKIKRLTAENLHRSWLNVPHVTHNDESNISDLESFRKQLNTEYAQQKKDIKLSPLAFIVKAVVNGLQQYPQFNSSLEFGGENLIYKKYFNIGIAVETPNGLVVPVVKDADKKSVAEIAKEMGELAKKARDKKLTMNDMSGACITISSLGGIGGTNFTPIVNTPEVAILGVSRSKMQPVWNGSDFEPGMILPLSLSYDHRVIDGAEAARFTRHIAAVLEDVRRLTV